MADYSEQQLFGALRKADAAGDTAAAKAIARRIQSMRQATPQAAPAAPQQPSMPAQAPDRATDGMGQYQRYIAGLGKSMVDTYQGIKQLGTAVIGELAGDRTGLTDGDNPITRWAARSGAEQREAQGERSRIDSDLMNTGAGMTGNVVGTIGQIIGPGAMLRGTAAGAALLPRTVSGNALQGAALGGIQPVSDEGDRARNTILGGALGGAGTAVPKVVGGAFRGVRSAIAVPTISGAERGAGQIIADESGDVAQLLRPAPSAVSGVQRGLAEESLNPGVARLERQMRGQTNIFQPIDTANNAARVRSLESFAGDRSTVRAAEQARDNAALPLLGRAYLDRGVDVGTIRSVVDNALEANATRPSVAAAINDVKGALDNAGDDVYSLYGVRKYIGDLLSGKAGVDKSYAKAATKELKAIQEVLDDEIGKRSTSFMQYLDTYRQASKPIDRMKTGQRLLAPDSGGAVLDPQTGAQILTPASFSKKARDMDAVAAKATGFKKARAEHILKPEDLAAIRAVQDDLERQSFRATAGSGGNSMTQERQMLQDKMGRRLAGRLPLVGGFVEALDQLGNQRVNERLAYLLANPDEARRVLNALGKDDKKTLSKALSQASAVGSVNLVPALAE